MKHDIMSGVVFYFWFKVNLKHNRRPLGRANGFIILLFFLSKDNPPHCPDSCYNSIPILKYVYLQYIHTILVIYNCIISFYF